MHFTELSAPPTVPRGEMGLKFILDRGRRVVKHAGNASTRQSR